MTLRIVQSVEGQHIVFRLCGRIRASDLAHIQELLHDHTQNRVLDLEEVTLVDREVVAFLRKCETADIQLAHCPPYIRKWISTA